MESRVRHSLTDLQVGFVVGGGLLLLGILLQVLLGPVRWDLTRWPVNLVLLILLLGLMALIYLLRGRVRACEWLLHYGSAVPCLVYAAVLTVLMGLTPQLRSGGVPWLSQMLSFWPFVLIWVWLTLSTGLVALNHLLRWRIKELPFVLNHLGLFVAIVSATLGNADMQRLQMPVRQGERVRVGP